MKTIYNRDHTKRVIVGPHGAFIAQKTDHSKGCKALPQAKLPIMHNDPWSMIQRPTFDLNLAKQQAGIEI